MHRSGTSALAGALNIAGLYLGEYLTEGREDNPKGFFEHDEIWRIHQSLLVDLGSDWDDMRALPEGWRDGDAAARAISNLRAIVERDFRTAALWGVKDPRMCRLFDLWPGLIQGMGAELRVILMLRHPVEVAQSLARRDGLDLAHGMALWLRYTLDAERATRSWPRLIQRYDDLLTDWRRELDRIDGALELGLPARAPERSERIRDFLDRGPRHQTIPETPSERASAGLVERLCARAYEAMSALRDDDGRAAVMDAVTSEFDAWERQAEPLCPHLSYAIGQRPRREDAIRWLEGERAAHTETMRSLEERFARLAEEGRDKVALLEAARASQSEKIRVLEDERTALSEEAREAKFRCDQKEADLLLAHRRVEALTGQLADAGVLIDRIHRSTSWRLTAPARRAVTFLRLARGRSKTAEAEIQREPPLTQTAPAPSSPAASHKGSGRSNAAAPGAIPQTAASGAAPSRARILLVTPDIHGPIRNGGIGTAFAALAIWFTRWGYDVSVLYALGEFTESEPVAHWQDHYAGLGINLIPLTAPEHGDMSPLAGSLFGERAWKVHAWLKTRERLFSLVIFPEWMGLAYYVLLSKGQGLAYRDLTIAVNAHSPENWALEGNRALPGSADVLDREFMERETVRRADWLISPSEYMLDWMRAHQWRLPDRNIVIQNLLGEAADHQELSSEAARIHELAFFGRLEFRKGVSLFCDAIDRLSLDERKHAKKIVFMGKSCLVQGMDSSKYIRLRSAAWDIPVDIFTDRNREQAIEYLSKPGVLAIIASLSENSPYTVLECLYHRICFLATAVGGIPELVHPEDRGNALCDPDPDSLRQGISTALQRGARAARMAHSQDKVRRAWLDWLEQATRAEAAAPTIVAGTLATQRPMISICLVHYNRPFFLDQALESLRRQTYGNFEVVLVDDGSPSDAAQAFLDALEPEFHRRGWTIIRQPNRYLGAARNRAAQSARGEYLLFMDDDNVAMANELEIFMKAASHSGADVLTCAAHVFHGDLAPNQPSESWLPLGGAAGAGLYRNVFGDANALWRREAFLKIGGYTTDYGVGHEDWELFAEAVLAGLRLEVVPEPLFWYRIHSGSMLRNGDVWANHVRSVRPYVRHDPSGLGLASAYAVCLLQSRIATMGSPGVRAIPVKGWRRLSNAVQLTSNPKNVLRFVKLWRNQGLRWAVVKSAARSRYQY